ncbi:MAG: pilus assembly protein [Actinomycetota bacterium]|nr:pilus assembly protein [Actinomycetota bacterium]
MLHQAGSPRRLADRGAAAVEFALVAPLLIFLLFAIIGYGYMLSFRQAISQAAAEGARAAAVAPSALTDAQVKTRAIVAINDALGTYDVTCTEAGLLKKGTADAGTCTVSAPQACTTSTIGAQCIKITLDYTYKDDSLIPSPGLGIVLPEHLNYSTEAQVS